MPDYDEAIGQDSDDEMLEELLAGELDDDEDDDEFSGDEEGLIVGASPREIFVLNAVPSYSLETTREAHRLANEGWAR